MWAKASTGTPKIGVSAVQFFGNTGGSPSASVISSGGTATISTSWARYSFTIAIPSIAGKTIATSNDDSLRIDMWTSVGSTISALGYPAVGIQNATIDTWGWQIEAGSTATDFQTATGSIGGELTLCQRYFQMIGGNVSSERLASLTATSSSTWSGALYFFTQMRSAPTLTFAGTFIFRTGANLTISSTNSGNISKNSAEVYGNGSGFTTDYPGFLVASNTSATISVSAEL